MATDAPELRWLGVYILSARKELGLSQAELAARSSLTQVQISLFESGRRRPSLDQFLAIARGLGVPVQRLLSGEDRPGARLPTDLSIELRRLGIEDLWIKGATVPGASRRPEEVISLALAGGDPDPRIIEAIPAVLAWNKINPVLLRAFGNVSRTTIRMAWLADVALSIERGGGFPGGCAKQPLERFLKAVEPMKPLPEADRWDDLGKPSAGLPPSPVWKRWRIKYDATLDQFEARAQHLHDLRGDIAGRRRIARNEAVRAKIATIRTQLDQVKNPSDARLDVQRDDRSVGDVSEDPKEVVPHADLGDSEQGHGGGGGR